MVIFKQGQFKTALLVAGTNLDHLKMSLNKIRTNLEALNLSYYSLDKFRCSKFVIFTQDKFRYPEFVPFASMTNLDGLDLCHFKKDNFKYSKFVLLVSRTNSDAMNLSI